MLMPVTRAALDQVGLPSSDIGFTCSGSTDYLAGSAFSFVSTLDGVGPWPPIQIIALYSPGRSGDLPVYLDPLIDQQLLENGQQDVDKSTTPVRWET